jgi:hypothetical protein
MYGILGVLLVLAWRNAGWFGLDRFVLGRDWTPRRVGTVVGRVTHRRVPVVPAATH